MTISPYEANILDFNALVTANPQLLTDRDRNSLAELLATLPEDIEQISDALALWCEDHSRVLDALLALPPGDTAERGPGGRPTRMTPQEAKELLDNIVRPGSPQPQPQNPPPQHE